MRGERLNDGLSVLAAGRVRRWWSCPVSGGVMTCRCERRGWRPCPPPRSPILRSGEVELRRLCVSDLEPLYRVITESIDHLLPWLPWAASHDRQQVEEYLAGSAEG
jgi:hypothetical protein